jgi:hypothetical protein
MAPIKSLIFLKTNSHAKMAPDSGIATKYLDSYLRWYHLAVLPRTPSPRAVLAAAAGMLNVRLACIANAN